MNRLQKIISALDPRGKVASTPSPEAIVTALHWYDPETHSTGVLSGSGLDGLTMRDIYQAAEEIKRTIPDPVLDSAISHAEEVARREAGSRCGCEHMELVSLLQELKLRRQSDNSEKHRERSNR